MGSQGCKASSLQAIIRHEPSAQGGQYRRKTFWLYWKGRPTHGERGGECDLLVRQNILALVQVSMGELFWGLLGPIVGAHTQKWPVLPLQMVGDLALVRFGVGEGHRGTCGFACCSTSRGCDLKGGSGSVPSYSIFLRWSWLAVRYTQEFINEGSCHTDGS